MLFEDESMIRDYQAIQKTWFLRGKQRINSNHGKIIVGSNCWPRLTMKRDDIVWQEDEQYTAETFLFLSSKGHGDLSNRETGSGFDNARIHQRKAVLPVSGSAKKSVFLSLCTCLHTAPVTVEGL
ncbi:hypothetical protein [Paenibacillus larvae]|uniref:hypothetical protein n=1 Tax=Paenibacillus larvae TaxID=1464 RepID=UPI0028904E69|nr:hypothetical protein [Paenibacillus larvae]MDT2194731.1 hypothetical protein [Paenibacillus larvae]